MHQFNGKNYFNWDSLYKSYLREILIYGENFTGRNGKTKYLFGSSVKADLRSGFPITSLRKLPFKNCVRELLFDLGFCQNVSALGKAKHFWDFLADEKGFLGSTAYNRQWRMYPPSDTNYLVENERFFIPQEFSKGKDQLKNAIYLLAKNPNSRRAYVATINPVSENQACIPCHQSLQFMITDENNDGTRFIDLMVPARSNDMSIGFPLDIIRYSLILYVVRNSIELLNKKLTLVCRYVYMPSSNSHIYENNFQLMEQLLQRESRQDPVVSISHNDIDDYLLDDFSLIGYNPHPVMKINFN